MSRRIPAICFLALLAALPGCSSPEPEVAADEPPPPQSETVEKTMIVILGASYAAGWNPDPSGGLQFANRGEGGQQSFEMLARFDRDVAEAGPDAVILWGYINDIFRCSREDVEAAKARARESFLEMIRKARAGGIEPILATEVTIRPKAGFREAAGGMVGKLLGKQSYQSYINRQVTELNRWLRDLAEAEDLLLLDFEKVLAGDGGYRKKEFAKDDGSHIPPAGYAAIDGYAGPILRRRYPVAESR